eukprot:7136503-Alexandrium_andersonii.AAC.1
MIWAIFARNSSSTAAASCGKRSLRRARPTSVSYARSRMLPHGRRARRKGGRPCGQRSGNR